MNANTLPAQPTAHTPGPWAWTGNRLGPVDKNPDAGHVHSILDAEGGHGYLGSKPSNTLAQLDADYRLIAAAPDLLAALQQTVTLLKAEGYGTAHADAAIAKATGARA